MTDLEQQLETAREKHDSACCGLALAIKHDREADAQLWESALKKANEKLNELEDAA